MGQDFSQLVPVEDGVPMEVRHPQTGEPIMNGAGPVTITLVGRDSAVYRRTMQDYMRKRVRDTRKVMEPDLEAERLELLVACTVDWSGIEWGPDPLPYSPANARMLYGKSPWLQEQAEGFIMDRANFFGASKTT